MLIKNENETLNGLGQNERGMCDPFLPHTLSFAMGDK